MDVIRRGVRLSHTSGIRLDCSDLISGGYLTEVSPDLLQGVVVTRRTTGEVLHVAGVVRVTGNILWVDGELGWTVPVGIYDVRWILTGVSFSPVTQFQVT